MKKTDRHPAGSRIAMRLPTVALPYAVTSMLRGGKRSLVVPAMFIGMMLFICVFYNMRTGFEGDIQQAYLDYPLIMRFTDITGKQVDGLVIKPSEIRKVAETEFVYKIYVENKSRYTVLGITQYADGSRLPPEEYIEEFVPHETREEREAFVEQWDMISTQWIGISDSYNAFQFSPEFAYSAAPKITWASGTDYNDFTYFNNRQGGDVIATEALLEKYNVSLGDTVLLLDLYPNDYIMGTLPMYRQSRHKIVGVFANESNTALFFQAAPNDYNESIIFDDYSDSGGYVFIYESVAFHLKEKRRLSEFKDWLEEHFNPVGVQGEHAHWAIIDDAAFYATMDSLNRFLGYLNMFYPIILGMVVGIGFLVSHLLLKSRAGEIAVLRGLGARKRTVFLSYFNEQFMLSLLGIAVGLGVAVPVLGGLSAISPPNVLLLCGCYYAGLALAIMQTYRKSTMKSLQMKEE
jgi:hypothetical protein